MSVERGIRRTVSGFQVYVRIDGEFRAKRFPPETTLTDLRAWRERQKARAVLNLPAGDDATGVGRDAKAYLALVTGLASYKDRAYRINRWVGALGASTDRRTLTAVNIRRQLERWRQAGSSAGTLNLLRTALLHLFTVLDGKSATNPVRDVPRYPERPAPVALPSWKDATKAIEAVGWRTNKDGRGRRASVTRLRLLVLLYTGWPASTLGRVQPEGVNAKAGTVLVTRQKGRGIRPRTVPVLPAALAATPNSLDNAALSRELADKRSGKSEQIRVTPELSALAISICVMSCRRRRPGCSSRYPTAIRPQPGIGSLPTRSDTGWPCIPNPPARSGDSRGRTDTRPCRASSWRTGNRP